MEINFRHGEALSLADQVFLFKRTLREAAFKHNLSATFMAKPLQNQAGSSMHIHQSVLDAHGNNIFVGKMEALVNHLNTISVAYKNTLRRSLHYLPPM